jgi:nucleotide-binding universal stress UspA family protein
MTSDTPSETEARIVVGVDGSEESKNALRWAARQATLTGAPLLAITTWHIPSSAYGAPVPIPTDYDFEGGSRSSLDTTIRDVLGDHAGVELSTAVLEGHPAPVLIKASADASLLVVGSRGHGAFTGMLLGSVSEHCVAHASCPVVVVRHLPPAA